MLTETEAVAYLLRDEILTPADLVQNELVVYDVSRRNRNLAIRTRGGDGWLLKQSDGRQSRKTLHREAD